MEDTQRHDQAQEHSVRYFEGRAVAYRPDYYYLGGHGYQLDIVYWIPERPDRKKRMSAEVFYALTTSEPTLTRREAAGLARLVDMEMPGLTRSERLGWASRVYRAPHPDL
ncbi:MAG: hypothetical protein KatS3mg051_1695 [Anaerolineae bacterium]|nr:MAG: hypothetical protein KatS3mg051_1695 [Anaerolineae bacterium]